MTSLPRSRVPSDAEVDRRRPTGPNPGVLATVSLILTVASVAASGVLAGAPYVSPLATPSEIAGFYRGRQEASALSAMLLFGSAVPLGILAATVYSRMLRLGVRVPGPSISFFGGIAAALLLMLSAFADWTAGRPELAGDPEVVRALLFLALLSGGTGYVVALGLLVAGAAVPALVFRLIPRWMGWAGLLIAVLADLTFFSMGFEPFQILLPIGRYGSLIWLAVVGFLLPTDRGSGG